MEHRNRPLLPLALLGLFCGMLMRPDILFSGTQKGLLLWYRTVLPTLFPFLFVCNLFTRTSALRIFARLAPHAVCRFFCVSPAGLLAVLTGFSCGCPMGAKVAADLYLQGSIDRAEAAYLLSFCSNTSPAFLLGYVVLLELNRPSLRLPVLLILFLSPVCVSFFTRIYYLCPSKKSPSRGRASHTCVAFNDPRPAVFSDVLEDSLMNAMETIAKIGGYIMLFCALTECVCSLPAPSAILTALAASLEITGGIRLLLGLALPFSVRFLLCVTLCAFGGWCAILQTSSVIRDTGLPLFPIVIEKLATAAAASFFTCLYLKFFY